MTAGRAVSTGTLAVTGSSVNAASWRYSTNQIGYLYSDSTGVGAFDAGSGTGNGIYIWTSANKVYLQTNNTNQLEVGSTGDITFKTGNVVQGTAAKGINFTANSAAAGMTSQLLNWYEEGTFTPTAYGGTSTGTTTYSARNGNYTRIGNVITVWVEISITAMTGTGNLRLGNFPYTSSSTGSSSIGAVQTSGLTWSQSPSSSTVQVNQNANYAVIYNSVDNGGWGITSTKNGTWSVYFTVTYRI